MVISPQLEKFSQSLSKEKNLTLELLSDLGNRVADKFGLVFKLPDNLQKIYLQFGIDVPKFNGDDAWRLPIPARYIIDQSSVIRYAKIDPDYTTRPEPAHTIAALKSIVG